MLFLKPEKKFMKYHYILLLPVFCLLSVNSCEKKNIRLTEATSQEWMGGAPGSGRGINYVVKFIIPKNINVEADSMWVNQKVLKLKTVRQQNNDTLVLKATEFISLPHPKKNMESQNNEVKKELPVTPPQKIKGAALLRYFINNKPYYFTIKEFKQMTTISYP